MNKKVTNETTNVVTSINMNNEKLTWNVNICILAIHIGLSFIFILVDAPIMVGMNIASVLIYIYLFQVINRNLIAYLIAVYAEVLVHMTLACLCMGWKCGFQLYFFSFIPIIYYCDYISKKRKLMKIYTLPMSIVVIAIFYMLRTIAYEDYAMYTHLSEDTCVVIYTINIIMTFAFLMLFMSMFENMSLRNEGMLQHFAEYDLLTNLSNRHRMTSIFDNLNASYTGYSVAILDIDNFKKVNDTYGHNVGDMALKAVADVLREVEDNNVYVCRWGGEEFLVVAAGDNTYEESKELLEQVRANVEAIRIPTEHGDLSVTVSCGIAKSRLGEKSSKTTNRADSYLYIAKNNGKNQIVANDNEGLY